MSAHDVRPAPPEVWFLTTELEGERAGSFRQERWCRVFLEAGSRIRAFNLRGAFAHTDAVCDTLEEFDSFRERSLAIAPRASSLREGWTMQLGRLLKHLLLIDLYLPNVVKLFMRASRMLAQRADTVLVMASSPPFSVALVGALLKLRHPDTVRLVIDMRDAWAMHNAMGGIRWIKRLIERWVLRRADEVLTVSRWLADEFAHEHGVTVRVMYNVATHYFGKAPATAPTEWGAVHSAIDPARLKVVYTGSTPRGHYDLSSFVGAVCRLRQESPELADRIQFILVGACSAVASEAERQGLQGNDLVFVPHLPHQAARAIQSAADLLLFFAHFGPGNKGVVSTKLFEYVCLDRPLLPLSLHSGSDVDQLLRRFCTGSVNAHTIAEMAAAFAHVARFGVASMPRLRSPDRTPELVEDYVAFARNMIARIGIARIGMPAAKALKT